jgi:hypothetical protein
MKREPAQPAPSRLDQTDPRVGDTLRFDGLEWEVTDHSSYWNDGGYRVNEWRCETSDVTAYLLKEQAERGSPKWLFTREIASEGVTLPDGAPVASVIRGNTSPAPPDSLHHEGQTYRHQDTTEGTYEDEPGQRVRKTTWDYWDAPHAKNLAVEVWADGRVDCYLGAYIRTDEATLERTAAPEEAPPERQAGLAAAALLSAGAAGARGGAGAGVGINPFAASVIGLAVVSVLALFGDFPLDRCLAVGLPVGALAGWLVALMRLPVTGLGALVLAPGLAVLFWRYPPLGSPAGLAALVAAPGAMAWLAWVRGVSGARPAAHYLAAFVVVGPLLGLGLYHYFQLAPGPHTLGQWLLAMGPAVLGGLGALVVSRIGLAVLGSDEG